MEGTEGGIGEGKRKKIVCGSDWWNVKVRDPSEKNQRKRCVWVRWVNIRVSDPSEKRKENGVWEWCGGISRLVIEVKNGKKEPWRTHYAIWEHRVIFLLQYIQRPLFRGGGRGNWVNYVIFLVNSLPRETQNGIHTRSGIALYRV